MQALDGTVASAEQTQAEAIRRMARDVRSALQEQGPLLQVGCCQGLVFSARLPQSRFCFPHCTQTRLSADLSAALLGFLSTRMAVGLPSQNTVQAGETQSAEASLALEAAGGTEAGSSAAAGTAQPSSAQMQTLLLRLGQLEQLGQLTRQEIQQGLAAMQVCLLECYVSACCVTHSVCAAGCRLRCPRR
jgi:hypothetical protein